MTPEVAYCVGLFEGEGSVIVPQRGQARLTMCSTDREPLDRLVDTWGGKVFGPYTLKKHPTRKPIYQWQLASWDGLQEIYDEIEHWLSPRRREQFQAVLRNPRRDTMQARLQRRRVHA